VRGRPPLAPLVPAAQPVRPVLTLGSPTPLPQAAQCPRPPGSQRANRPTWPRRPLRQAPASAPRPAPRGRRPRRTPQASRTTAPAAAPLAMRTRPGVRGTPPQQRLRCCCCCCCCCCWRYRHRRQRRIRPCSCGRCPGVARGRRWTRQARRCWGRARRPARALLRPCRGAGAAGAPCRRRGPARTWRPPTKSGCRGGVQRGRVGRQQDARAGGEAVACCKAASSRRRHATVCEPASPGRPGASERRRGRTCRPSSLSASSRGIWAAAGAGAAAVPCAMDAVPPLSLRGAAAGLGAGEPLAFAIAMRPRTNGARAVSDLWLVEWGMQPFRRERVRRSAT
jgi:hypothetical protein